MGGSARLLVRLSTCVQDINLEACERSTCLMGALLYEKDLMFLVRHGWLERKSYPYSLHAVRGARWWIRCSQGFGRTQVVGHLCTAQRRQASIRSQAQIPQLQSRFAHQKSESHKSYVQISKKSILYPFLHLFSSFEMTTQKAKAIVTRVGFEPTPFRTSVLGLTLSWRLRPLGHLAF